MIILFSIEVVILAMLLFFSGGRFNEEMSAMEEKNGVIRFIVPPGLLILKLFRHECKSAYEKNLEIKLQYLSGKGMAHLAVRVHMAKKIMLMYLLLVFVTFVGTQIEFDMAYVILSAGLLCAVFVLTDRQLDEKFKERQREMQIEFPEFLNKLILLVNAGLTVRGAMQKIIKENKKDNPLYKELIMIVNDINTGKNEIAAYEDFARRCRLQEVTMFTATLIQNLRKGSDQLVPVLRLQAAACWENRKNLARKMGEEASTKLIFPMAIVFVAILIMVMTPAVMQIQI